MQISAIIVTLNEERNLARALSSLAPVCDELLVVDSGSTDRTREVAEQVGARFLFHQWQGYAAQKNFAAAQARHDWVLSLDADEELSPALAAEIQTLKREAEGDVAGFTMPRLACYRGSWVRHSGWYPDPKLRLYDRRRGRWVGDYLHESVDVNGPVRKLTGDLLHYTCNSVAEHLRTLDRYTDLAAQQAVAQRESWALLRMLVLAPWKFVETYIFRQGFRDGTNGIVIAAMASHYVWEKYRKLWRLQAQEHDASNGAHEPLPPGRDRGGDRSA